MIAAVCLLATGCASHEKQLEQRRAALLRVYPLHTTTREDVAKKWSPLQPEVACEKPSSGWLAIQDAAVGSRASAIESKLRSEVARVDRYFGTYGFGLCRCWFFFDAADRLVDVEWQYVSD